MANNDGQYTFQHHPQGPHGQARNTANPSGTVKRAAPRGCAPAVAQSRIQAGPLSNPLQNNNPALFSLTSQQAGGQGLAHPSASTAIRSAYATAPPGFLSHSQNNLGVNQWYLPQDTTRGTTTPAQSVDNHNHTYPAEPAWQSIATRGSSQAYQIQQLYASAYTEQLPPNRRVRPAIHITPATLDRQQEASIYAPESSQFRYFQQDYSPFFTMAATYEQPPQVPDLPQPHVPATPISPHSGPSRGVSPVRESTRRKRSFSQIDQQLEETTIDAALQSTSPQGLYMDDEQQVRVTRTIKRSDAPINDNHKFICTAAPECASLTFDRKCEWSKHMDKHDRPYRCPHAQCAKLQGFTYSGGLLRHEREVHNKHGGPKALLMCPHINCKRHTEKGFTRRENLQEHIRRVHQGVEAPEQTHVEDLAPAADLEAPAPTLSDAAGEEIYAALSSKQSAAHDPREPFEGIDELRQQIQRLKAESDAKDAVIHQLESETRARSEQVRDLEHRLGALQPAMT